MGLERRGQFEAVLLLEPQGRRGQVFEVQRHAHQVRGEAARKGVTRHGARSMQVGPQVLEAHFVHGS
jgi:hypothetical protein